MTFATLVVPFALTSCGSDFDYEPGAAVSSDCQNVYFSDENESEIFVTADDEKSVSIKLKREKTEGSLTVPIIVDSYSGTPTIPESVTFNDGEDEANLVITYETPEGGIDVKMHVDDAYANPYKEKDGTISFTLSIMQLVKVCSVTFDSSSPFSVVESDIYNYSGMNKFKWENFLGSGIDINFEVEPASGVTFDSSDLSSLNGTIKFLDHVYDYYGNGSIYLMDDTGDYASWTLEGQTSAITYFYMYDGSYSSINFSPNSTAACYFYASYPTGGYLSFYLNF